MSRLDLGGGTSNTKAPGHINIDICEGADILHDLNQGLPFHEISDRVYPERKHEITNPRAAVENSVEGIRCHQVLEHLREVIPLMNDCYEVLKPGGIMEISTPVARSDQWYQDPTHVRAFIEDTFLYFTANSAFAKEQELYGITARFEQIKEVGKTGIFDGWELRTILRKPL